MKIVKLLLLTSIMMLLSNHVFAQLDWVAFDGELPNHAVIGGVESHRSLPVCRCEYKGAMHPGKVVEKKCNIGYGGLEKTISQFEVLVNKGVVELDWLKTNGSLPDHAVQGGTENGKPLYVGRVFYKNGTHPGKVFKVGTTYICNIGYAGKEITLKTFEVLVENNPMEKIKTLGSDDILCSGKANSRKGVINYSDRIGSIGKEDQLDEGFSLVSNNLKYQTRVTGDGRLVIEEIKDYGFCENGKFIIFKAEEIWTNTSEKRDPKLDYYLKFQDDGNLCIYSKQNGFVWCAMSNGRNGHHFEITNIGHIEVVDDHGNEVWPD